MGSQSSAPVDESIKIFVDDAISKTKVVVFSKSYCPHCRKAKGIINDYNVKDNCLEVIEIEKRPDCSQIQSYLKTLTGASSVPRIFIAAKSVGGCDDLVKVHESGQLRQMLVDCGAI